MAFTTWADAHAHAQTRAKRNRLPMRLTILQVGQNTKLGPNVATWSRPVGPSCPNSCPFLNTACYAQKMQNFRPSVAKSWARQGGGREYWGEWARTFRQELEAVARRNLMVRGHVAGDFMLDGVELDRPYLAAVLWAFHRANPRPVTWIYTHAWKALGWARPVPGWPSHAAALVRAGIQIFASVHSEGEGRQAVIMGYRLAIDRGITVKAANALPSWVRYANTNALRCPEQKCGHAIVTCSTCRFCFRPERTESVIFDRH